MRLSNHSRLAGRKAQAIGVGTLTVLLLTGCTKSSSGSAGSSGSSSPSSTNPSPDFDSTLALRELGRPLEGLTVDEFAAFERGREVFHRRFKPSEGLGPFYNATSCVSCHSSPVAGGSSPLYRNFYVGLFGTPGPFQRALPPSLSPIIPAFGTGTAHLTATFSLEGGRPVIPREYLGTEVTVAQRNSIPIFGTGLFEFVPNSEILSRTDPSDADGDGVSGRHNLNMGAVGRFGLKAQSNNIELFTRGPLQNQMGITTDPFLGAGGIVSHMGPVVLQGGSDFQPTTDNDGVPDPELSHDDLGDLIAFTRFLAPPKSLPFDEAALRGETLFDQIGCTKCHVPELPSSRGPVRAYTDLLVHNMGADLWDNLQFGGNGNTTREFRTQPLWGVALFPPYLHDGRAATIEEAILWHGGEAERHRNAYVGLTTEEQADILSFLEHL